MKSKIIALLCNSQTLSDMTLSHEDNGSVLDVFVVCANVIVDFAV